MAKTESPATGIGVKDLLEAGLHFGHQTKRWNPKMKPFIFDKRNGIHIIDLSKSMGQLREALQFVYEVVVSGKQILFVGTKKQAQESIKETAVRTGQHYVTHRWLGGTLTNTTTIRRSVRRMREIEDMEKKGTMAELPKKEAAGLRRELEKLQRNLSGIANMDSMPGAMFVVDINREAIAVKEASRLNIPVIAIVDTNCNPDPIDIVIPGNDDAIRAIGLITGALADVVAKGAAEYAEIAAELARKKEAEAKEAEARKAKEAEKAKAEREKAEIVAAEQEAAAAKALAEREATLAKKAAAKAKSKKEAGAPATEPAAASNANPDADAQAAASAETIEATETSS
ncbi:MAG: 30S ribosomal protein S2 [Verrucomicrobia bacterium]|nr:30S ribosomal protein S2 [Verrucomicrobiota bacterium]